MRPALLALALTGTAAAAQDLDAVAAAPGNHTILLENDEVRVLQVEVAPGATEPVHSHRWPSVMHIQAPQPLTDILYREEGGKLVEVNRVEIPAGSPPAALWAPPEAPHAIVNHGTTPFRALRIELKKARPDGGK